MPGEGHGSGEDPENTAVKNPPAALRGAWDVVTVDDETGEVSSGRLPTAIVTMSISRKTKSQRKPDEKSEEAIVPVGRKSNDG
jgi:hypothetical protein